MQDYYTFREYALRLKRYRFVMSSVVSGVAMQNRIEMKWKGPYQMYVASVHLNVKLIETVNESLEEKEYVVLSIPRMFKPMNIVKPTKLSEINVNYAYLHNSYQLGKENTSALGLVHFIISNMLNVVFHTKLFSSIYFIKAL